ENEPTEEAEVLEKVHLLLGPRGRIGLLPETVPGVRRRDDGTDEGQRGDPPVLPDGQEDPAADLHGPVDAYERLRVQLVDPDTLAEGLTDRLCLLGFALRIPQGVPSSDHKDGCEQRASDSRRKCHGPVSTRISKRYPLKIRRGRYLDRDQALTPLHFPT